jgi:predicted class III extradiol MEMO1 family dioxygenase
VLAHFKPDQVFLLGGLERPEFKKYLGVRNAEEIDTADSLPDLPLVVFAPPSGRVHKGEVALRDFDHSKFEDAIYLFGPDHKILDENFMGSREPTIKVYIETDSKDEMYSHVAAAIALYGRKTNLG